jgi:hypothetical protein
LYSIFLGLLDEHYGRCNSTDPANSIVKTGFASDESAAPANGVGLVGSENQLRASLHVSGGPQDIIAIANRRAKRVRLDDSERWGGRYALKQSKLYIVVHDICGNGLQNRVFQSCMSILAACRSVSVVATIENINSAVCWDRATLARYQWVYEHVPLFRCNKMVLGDGNPFLSTLQAEIQSSEESIANDDVADVDLQVPQRVPVSGPVRAPAESVTSVKAKAGGGGGSSSSSNSAKEKNVSKPAAKKASKPAAASVNANVAALESTVSALQSSKLSNASSLALRSFEAIMKSLTTTHKQMFDFFLKAVRHKAAQDSSSSSSGNITTSGTSSSNRGGIASKDLLGVPLSAFFEILRNNLVVKNVKELKQLLREFADHSVIVITSGPDGTEKICLKPPFDILLKEVTKFSS